MSQEMYKGPFPELVEHLEFQRDTLVNLAERYNLDLIKLGELTELLVARIIDLQNLPPDADMTAVMDNFWEQSAEFGKKVIAQK